MGGEFRPQVGKPDLRPTLRPDVLSRTSSLLAGGSMSRITKSAAIVMSLAIVLTACSASSDGTAQRTVSVTGTGTARLTPDIVIVTLGVQTQDPQVSKAVEDNNARASRVTDAVKAEGVAAADIQTSNFSVWSQQSFDPQGNPTGEITYNASNTLTLTLRDVSKLGDLLQMALESGANSVQNVSYSVADPSEALDKARLEAIQDAHDQASQLADAAGAQLGPVFNLNEYSPTPIMTFAAQSFGKGGGGGGVPASPGTLEYQVQVYIVYTLR
jgi:uncharacterized protein YggE